MNVEQSFGRVEWCKADVENALDINGYGTSEENVSEILGMIDDEKLIAAQIEAGWEYIFSLIDNAAKNNLLR